MAERDVEMDRVIAAIDAIDPDGRRCGDVLRKTLDQLYDGLHTGRYRWDQLFKTEKTHCGTLVEINLQREFGFEDGGSMDYRIAGVEVDCKYSQAMFGWMIPPESVGHLCLLMSADDEAARWSLGIARIHDEMLNQGGNRDGKRTIAAGHRDRIRWIRQDHVLPPNILLQLPRRTVDQLMSLDSGQKRIDQIFRIAQGQRIGRGVIATLGRQDDFMKRVRGNGGSRTRLKTEGIIILGHYEEHRRIAVALGVPPPNRGESVSVQVVPAVDGEENTVRLEGRLWRTAKAGDPITEAPECRHC